LQRLIKGIIAPAMFVVSAGGCRASGDSARSGMGGASSTSGSKGMSMSTWVACRQKGLIDAYPSMAGPPQVHLDIGTIILFIYKVADPTCSNISGWPSNSACSKTPPSLRAHRSSAPTEPSLGTTCSASIAMWMPKQPILEVQS
jgi:hypothetical protein